MATVTFDGRGFMLDGRRILIVSGGIHFGRVAPESWADRIHAAKLAGLNTIETPVFWNRVEPRPGQFDFTGQNDVREFVRLCGEAGMRVILRPGPYAGHGWDFGGLPAWLTRQDNVQLRTVSPGFLEASSRYISALADQVKDLQVTAAGEGGPILLIQCEHEWTCGDDAMATGYLGELHRYMRESGLSVPLINANMLWQGLEGQLECWSGGRDLYAMMRQLGHVNPEQPRFTIDFGRPSPSAALGLVEMVEAEVADQHPLLVQRRAAEALAAGGQINISPFAGGTSFGFTAGMKPAGEHRYLGPTYDPFAPVAEDGTMSPAFGPVRRLTHFAGSFSRVFANLEPERQPIVLDPSESSLAGSGDDAAVLGGLSVVNTVGTQGSVTFIFRPASELDAAAKPAGKSKAAKEPARIARLLNPDGSFLSVPLGEQLVSWCVHNAHLGGKATLDYSSLNLFGYADDLLVVYGPAGAVGELSVNGTPLEVQVPKGLEPLVERHKEITVIILSEEGVDHAFYGTAITGAAGGEAEGDDEPPREACVYCGVSHVTAIGDAVPLPGQPYTVVHRSGESEAVGKAGRGAKSKVAKPPVAPKVTIDGWQCSPTDDHTNGISPRFAAIDGPAELGDLGAEHGYGWYRAALKVGATKELIVGDVGMADRVQLIVDGEPVGVLGEGAGASHELMLSLKKGGRTVVLLADNMGRTSGGSFLADQKGVTRHLAEVNTLELEAPALVEDDPLDPLEFASPCFGVRRGDVTSSLRVVWTVAHRRKTSLELVIGPSPCRGVLVVNGEFERYIDSGVRARVELDQERLTRGNNEISFMPMADDVPSEDDAWRLTEELSAVTVLREIANDVTGKGEWAFAKWEPPGPAQFVGATKSSMGDRTTPTWWRASFTVSDDAYRGPIAADLTGMTKGQVYLNGKHVGRYFQATADGTELASARPVALPEAWMSPAGAANMLMIFDEHGGNPGKIKLAVPGMVVRAEP